MLRGLSELSQGCGIIFPGSELESLDMSRLEQSKASGPRRQPTFGSRTFAVTGRWSDASDGTTQAERGVTSASTST